MPFNKNPVFSAVEKAYILDSSAMDLDTVMDGQVCIHLNG